jgi:hypothetical protein
MRLHRRRRRRRRCCRLYVRMKDDFFPSSAQARARMSSHSLDSHPVASITSTSSSASTTSSTSSTSITSPSSFFSRHGAQLLPSLSGSAVSEEHAILEPFRYTCSVAGKGMRSRIIEVFNYWLKVSDGCRSQTAAIVEKLHNASLIIGAATATPTFLSPRFLRRSAHLTAASACRRHRGQLPAASRPSRRSRSFRRGRQHQLRQLHILRGVP